MTDSTTHDKTPTLQQSLEVIYARRKLEKLAACDGIKPQRAGDELVVCLNDQVELRGNPYRHSVDEIRALRELAGPGWPS